MAKLIRRVGSGHCRITEVGVPAVNFISRYTEIEQSEEGPGRVKEEQNNHLFTTPIYCRVTTVDGHVPQNVKSIKHSGLSRVRLGAECFDFESFRAESSGDFHPSDCDRHCQDGWLAGSGQNTSPATIENIKGDAFNIESIPDSESCTMPQGIKLKLSLWGLLRLLMELASYQRYRLISWQNKTTESVAQHLPSMDLCSPL